MSQRELSYRSAVVAVVRRARRVSFSAVPAV
jgi:hypothetical protein